MFRTIQGRTYFSHSVTYDLLKVLISILPVLSACKKLYVLVLVDRPS